ncbi:MAG: hypothetical protein Kow0089_09780 [Desulfobulbaceae bacterium]
MTRYLFLLSIPLADFLTLESDIFASTSLFSPPSTFFALVFILALLGASVFFLKKHPLLRFAILFFFINHLVESSFIGLELYFEHRNYLPSIFFYLAVAYYFCRLLSWYRGQRRRFMPGLLTVFMTFVLVSEGNATYLRNEVWETEISLLGDSLKKAPENIRVYISLASALADRGELPRAITLIEEAENKYNKQPERYQKYWSQVLFYNHGIYLMRQARLAEAVAKFDRSIELGSRDWQCYANKAFVLFQLHEEEKAEMAIAVAAELAGDDADPDLYNLYGRILYQVGKTDEALQAFQKGITLGETRELMLNVVASHIQMGNIKVARKVLDKIPHDERDLAYLLYRASLLSGSERQESLSNIVAYLLSNGEPFCSWLQEIRENHLPGIIYPDISRLEGELVGEYSLQLEKSAQEIRKRLKRVRICVTGKRSVIE